MNSSGTESIESEGELMKIWCRWYWSMTLPKQKVIEKTKNICKDPYWV